MNQPLISCGIRCSVCLELLSIGQVNEESRGTCEPVIRTGLLCPQCLSIDAIAGPSQRVGNAEPRART